MPDANQLAPCAELRSKKWHFLKAAPRSAADLLDASNSLWCARTSGLIGPDSQPVDAEDCCSERNCYVAGFTRHLGATTSQTE